MRNHGLKKNPINQLDIHTIEEEDISAGINTSENYKVVEPDTINDNLQKKRHSPKNKFSSLKRDGFKSRKIGASEYI